MRKIIIVDYSLEIVIEIIIYDHYLHWMFIPLFEATAGHILEENKQAENTNWKTKVNYTVYWISFFFK